MKPKNKPGANISTTQSDANQKNYKTDSESMNLGTSLLKKNEFAVIIVGALVVTVVVFFVFFKSSDPKTSDSADLPLSETATGSFMALEKRIGDIESVLKTLQAQQPGTLTATAPAETAPLEQKFQQLETSASVKFDSLIERMGDVEKQIRSLNQKLSTQSVPVKAPAPVKSPQKTPSKKIVKKSTKPPVEKAAMFHTIQKGETLWSIAKKYQTSVANLRKLNNMSSNATIYPGTNILVR
jgi:LysM repeat protein